MQTPPNDGCTRNPQCNCTIFLLLFVGFVFGFSVGFMTKDTITGTVSSWMVKNFQPADEQGMRSFTPAGEPQEEQPIETQSPEGEGEKPVATPAPEGEGEKPAATPAPEGEGEKPAVAPPQENASE